MAAKRILLILGHPQQDSLCAALVNAYAQAAQAAGHELRWLRLHELEFDPLLHHGYSQVQPLEPDLQAAQASILWANHLVWAYPIWWGGMPALLKGFIDRVFLPGFAFRFKSGSAWPDRLLKGRTAQLLLTMDTPPWYFRWVYGQPALRQMKATTLELCGIKPVKIACFGPVVSASEKQRKSWVDKAGSLVGELC